MTFVWNGRKRNHHQTPLLQLSSPSTVNKKNRNTIIWNKNEIEIIWNKNSFFFYAFINGPPVNFPRIDWFKQNKSDKLAQQINNDNR